MKYNAQRPQVNPTSSNGPDAQPQSTAYLTQSRLELHEWFNRNAPSLGELYEGALRMLYGEDNFPGKTRFVAHSVREIRNRLPDVITGQKVRGRFDCINRLDELAEDWKKAGLSLESVIPMQVTAEQSIPSSDIRLSRKLMQKIATLLKDHVAAREKRHDTATRLFKGFTSEDQNLGNTLRPVIMQWMDVTEWFMKKTHDSGNQDNSIDGKEFIRNFELFEKTLGALEHGFFTTVEGLDEILEDANS